MLSIIQRKGHIDEHVQREAPVKTAGRISALGVLATALILAVPTWSLQAQEKPATQVAAEQININTADAKTIADVLVGVGDSKAKAIVEFREQNGPFTSVDQLTDVNGIGEAILSQNRERIKLE